MSMPEPYLRSFIRTVSRISFAFVISSTASARTPYQFPSEVLAHAPELIAPIAAEIECEFDVDETYDPEREAIWKISSLLRKKRLESRNSESLVKIHLALLSFVELTGFWRAEPVMAVERRLDLVLQQARLSIPVLRKLADCTDREFEMVLLAHALGVRDRPVIQEVDLGRALDEYALLKPAIDLLRKRLIETIADSTHINGMPRTWVNETELPEEILVATVGWALHMRELIEHSITNQTGISKPLTILEAKRLEAIRTFAFERSHPRP